MIGNAIERSVLEATFARLRKRRSNGQRDNYIIRVLLCTTLQRRNISRTSQADGTVVVKVHFIDWLSARSDVREDIGETLSGHFGENEEDEEMVEKGERCCDA